MAKTVKIREIKRDLRFQLRNAVDPEHVNRLVEAIKDGAELPAITLTTDKVLVDGWHRVEANEKVGRKTIKADVREFADDNEIRVYGVKQNMTHGLNLSWPDEIRAAAKALLDSGMGQADVARALGCKLMRSGNAPTWIQTIARGHSRPEAKRLRAKEQASHRKVQSLTEEELRDSIKAEFGVKAYSQRYNPVVRWSRKTKNAKAPGTPILFISDWHFGETVVAEEVHGVNGYDWKIAVKRLKHTAETAVSLLKSHLAHADYPGLVLCLGGDMISGGLHDELRETDFPHTKGEQARQAAEHLSDMVAFLADEFPRITVYGVPGNHGRNTRRPRMKLYAEDNFDYHTYLLVERDHRATKNVEFNFPKAREITFDVANRKFLLLHGDQFRGGDGIIGSIGPITRGSVRKMHSIVHMPDMESFDTLMCGHHHQLIMTPRIIVNGSVKGFDEYALGINATYEPPQQALITVHETHGITWMVPIYCDPQEGSHEDIGNSGRAAGVGLRDAGRARAA